MVYFIWGNRFKLINPSIFGWSPPPPILNSQVEPHDLGKAIGTGAILFCTSKLPLSLFFFFLNRLKGEFLYIREKKLRTGTGMDERNSGRIQLLFLSETFYLLNQGSKQTSPPNPDPRPTYSPDVTERPATTVKRRNKDTCNKAFEAVAYVRGEIFGFRVS